MDGRVDGEVGAAEELGAAPVRRAAEGCVLEELDAVAVADDDAEGVGPRELARVDDKVRGGDARAVVVGVVREAVEEAVAVAPEEEVGALVDVGVEDVVLDDLELDDVDLRQGRTSVRNPYFFKALRSRPFPSRLG